MNPQDLLYQYAFGYMAGAGCKPIDLKREQHPDFTMAEAYQQGHKDGRLARGEAIRAYANKVGAKITVLRASDIYENPPEA